MTLKKVSYICFVLCLLIVVGALSSPTVFGQKTEPTNINSVLRKYEIITLNTKRLAQRAEDGQIISIRTASRSFDLQVEPYDLRSTDYKAVEELGFASRELKTSPITTFKGIVIGNADTDVRLSITQGKFEGMIITPTEQLYIEPLKRFDEKASEASFVIYDKSDVLEKVDLTLDGKVSDAAVEYAPQTFPTDSLSLPLTHAVAAVREIEIATETDYEYVQTLGGSQAANNEILGILNQVDAIYQRDLGLTVKVVYQHTWATSDDPYGAGLNNLLDEFRTYWNNNFTNIRRDVAHIWTNNSESNIAGLAYFAVVCKNASFSYGLSKRLSTATTRTVVTAHEIGHNIGAEHVEGGSCDNTIMNPGVGSGTQTTFCQTSRNQIGSYVSQNSSCLSETGGGSGNLALNKSTTTSATCNSNETGAKAVNGSVAGGNSDKWCAIGANNWLRVDLGANYDLTRFVVKHAAAGGESATWNTRNFNIETSSDGQNWSPKVNVTGNMQNETTHTIGATTARYVRLYVTQPQQNSGGAARIYEFEVYR